MTTKLNSFIVTPNVLELRILLNPQTAQMEIRAPRGVPTITAVAMLIDALQSQFQFFVNQQAGILGQKNPLIVDEPEAKPEPEKVV